MAKDKEDKKAEGDAAASAAKSAPKGPPAIGENLTDNPNPAEENKGTASDHSSVISNENEDLIKVVGGGPVPRLNPVPATVAGEAGEAFAKAGEGADIPNPLLEDPTMLPVPPGPGATKAASMIAQNWQPPSFGNEPFTPTKPKTLGGPAPEVQRIRHISEIPGYLGARDSVTGEPNVSVADPTSRVA